MKMEIDTDARLLRLAGDPPRTLPLDGPEAFALLSDVWLRVGWGQRYSYRFTWLGRPVVQLPEDLLRVQEAIWRTRPDVVVETGVAHGGSLVFYASLFEALGSGRVVGVDIEIRPPNRAALEAHPLAHRIDLVEGSSTDADVLEQVRALCGGADRVMVILDADHTADHVHAELEAYHSLVRGGCWLVATDGIMRDLTEIPGVPPTWRDDNPCTAVARFLEDHPDWTLDPPAPLFDESTVAATPTYWPDAWLRRRGP